MTTTTDPVPHPMSKEEGNARLDAIRSRCREARQERLQAQQRISTTFHDRRD